MLQAFNKQRFTLFTLACLGIAVSSCKPSKEALLENFIFNETLLQPQYTSADQLRVQLQNPQSIPVDSVVYAIDQTRLKGAKQLQQEVFSLTHLGTGYHEVKAKLFMAGDTLTVQQRIELVSPITPKILTYTLVKQYPHDTAAFTEGYEFYNDQLWESTGQKGSSYIAQVNPNTGKTLKRVDLESQYFGEGITFYHGQIFQLSWQDQTGFIYDAQTLKRIKTFAYDKPIEGWGMTHNEQYIFHSDGTEKIWKMDPKTQKEVGYINVYAGTEKIKSINELEWVNGKIYGNIWQKDAIAIIDPATGHVEAVLNLSDLRTLVKNPEAEVLNGIAYRPSTQTLWVTGKNWDSAFEIKVKE